MPSKFDAKSFNPQAFQYRVDRVPRTRLNEMRKSRILAGNPDIRNLFTTQDGAGYARTSATYSPPRTAPVTPGSPCAACWTGRP